jgi:hypothetical protein
MEVLRPNALNVKPWHCQTRNLQRLERILRDGAKDHIQVLVRVVDCGQSNILETMQCGPVPRRVDLNQP